MIRPWLLFIAVSASLLFGKAASKDTVQAPADIAFTGIIADTVFRADTSLSVELLETGESHPARFAKPFRLTLPVDTLWNLCVTGTAKEKCYEVHYKGAARAFSFTISSDALMTRYDDSTETRVPDSAFVAKDSAASADSLDVDDFLNSENAQVTELKKVVVQLRRRPRHKIGQSVVSAKSIQRMPGLAEADVMRSIQAQPGVVSSSDFSTKIYVRGGASDQNLFLFDNGVVYSPTHFFGLFSSFLVDGIDDVNFYKGGFPVQYGNRLSSVLDMHSKEGGEDTTDSWIDNSVIRISTFAASAHTEGHEGDFRWNVSGRTTYIKQVLDLCNWIGLLDFSLDYRFTDLQGAVSYNLGEGRELQLSVYTGKDVLDFDPISLEWGNTVIPLNFNWRFNDTWTYRATFAYTYFYQVMNVANLYNIKNDIYTIAVKQSMEEKVNDEHTVTAGYDFEYDNVMFYEKFSSQSVKDNPGPFLHSLYLMDSWQFNPSWHFIFGTRADYQTLANDFGLEPRFSADLRIDETKTMEFHVGRYLQYLNSIMFSDQESLNEFYYPSVTKSDGTRVKPSSSLLFSVDYTQHEIFNEWTGEAAVYYKTQNNLLTYSTNGADTTQNAKKLADYFGNAEGYSFGYELSMRRDEGKIFGGISWSQGWSVVKDGDGTVYYPNWHQPYSVKIDAGINWKGEKDAFKKTTNGRYLRSSLAFKYACGMPVTEKIGYFSDASLPDAGTYQNGMDGTSYVVFQGQRNGGKQSNYLRLDAKIIDWGREDKWNFSWTIINVTDHQNVFSYSYDTSKNPPELVKTTQFPFLPILLSYEYHF